jgi:membrane protein
LFKLTTATIRRTHSANVPALAAVIAFHALLSVAPLMLLLVTAASSVLGSAVARARLLEAIESLGDPAIVPPLRTTVEMIVDARSSLIANTAGILIMVYFASAVFHELVEALNRIWGVPPRTGIRGLVMPRLIGLVIVPAAIAAGMLVMAISFMNALAEPILTEMLPRANLWHLSRMLIPYLLMAGLLALLYRFGPRTAVGWCDVRVGSALTALAYTAGNVVLAMILRKSVLASLYGAAGALILLLLWIFYSAHILLIGACFTREYCESHGSRASRPEKSVTVVHDPREA